MNQTCPACGAPPTVFGHPLAYHRQRDFASQRCSECELPCRHWEWVSNLLRAREAALRECVKLYANKDNWGCTAMLTHDHDCESEPQHCCYDEWQGPTGVHGFEPAQAALAEIAAMGARE